VSKTEARCSSRRMAWLSAVGTDRGRASVDLAGAKMRNCLKLASTARDTQATGGRMFRTWGGLCLVIACLFWTSAQAQETVRTFSNPLIEAFGEPIGVSSVEVRYPADAFDAGLDRPSARYIAQHFSTDAKLSFEAFAAARGDAPDAIAERFSEYLAEADLRSRLASPGPEARALKVAIDVNDVHFRGMLASALAPSFPSTDMSFTLYDGQTNAVFASGHIRRCASSRYNIDEARAKHDLQFNWSGTDTNLRMMA
jgi:hypothetical protein